MEDRIGILPLLNLTGVVVFSEKAAFDVFISYRVSSDQEIALALYDKLRAAGLTVWLVSISTSLCTVASTLSQFLWLQLSMPICYRFN